VYHFLLDLYDGLNNDTFVPNAVVSSPYVLPSNASVTSLEVGMEIDLTVASSGTMGDTFTFTLYYRTPTNNTGTVALANLYVPLSAATLSISVNNTNTSLPGYYNASNKVVLTPGVTLPAGTHLLLVVTDTQLGSISRFNGSTDDSLGFTGVDNASRFATTVPFSMVRTLLLAA